MEICVIVMNDINLHTRTHTHIYIYILVCGSYCAYVSSLALVNQLLFIVAG